MGYNGGGIGKFFTYIVTVHNYIWLCIVAESYKEINFLFYLLLKYYLFVFFLFLLLIPSDQSPFSQLSLLPRVSLAPAHPEAQRHRPTPSTHAADPCRWPISPLIWFLGSWVAVLIWFMFLVMVVDWVWFGFLVGLITMDWRWLFEFDLGFWLGWSLWLLSTVDDLVGFWLGWS